MVSNITSEDFRSSVLCVSCDRHESVKYDIARHWTTLESMKNIRSTSILKATHSDSDYDGPLRGETTPKAVYCTLDPASEPLFPFSFRSQAEPGSELGIVSLDLRSVLGMESESQSVSPAPESMDGQDNSQLLEAMGGLDTSRFEDPYPATCSTGSDSAKLAHLKQVELPRKSKITSDYPNNGDHDHETPPLTSTIKPVKVGQYELYLCSLIPTQFGPTWGVKVQAHVAAVPIEHREFATKNFVPLTGSSVDPLHFGNDGGTL